MGKYSKEDYEFERNKQAILELRKQKQTQSHPAVWEYELNEHRRREKKDKFLMFGAWLGILSFGISALLLLNTLYHFIG